MLCRSILNTFVKGQVYTCLTIFQNDKKYMNCTKTVCIYKCYMYNKYKTNIKNKMKNIFY